MPPEAHVASGGDVQIIDDDPSVRRSLAFLLSTAGLTAQTHPSSTSFLAAAGRMADGCVVTDVRMPEMDGLELTRRLKGVAPHLPVVLITGHADLPLAIEAIRAGVVDLVRKPYEDVAILAAVHAALELGRGRRRARGEQGGGERAKVLDRIAGLTARERDVMDLLVAGGSNREIAAALGISARTVEFYRANLMDKMKADNLAALVRTVLTASPLPPRRSAGRGRHGAV